MKCGLEGFLTFFFLPFQMKKKIDFSLSNAFRGLFFFVFLFKQNVCSRFKRERDGIKKKVWSINPTSHGALFPKSRDREAPSTSRFTLGISLACTTPLNSNTVADIEALSDMYKRGYPLVTWIDTSTCEHMPLCCTKDNSRTGGIYRENKWTLTAMFKSNGFDENSIQIWK